MVPLELTLRLGNIACGDNRKKGRTVLSPELCQFLGYWQSLKDGDAPPDRSRLDLRQLTSLMPWMFILEMAADGTLRYRLAGSSIEAAVGRGLAGKAYADMLENPDQSALVNELCGVALVQCCGLLRVGTFSFGQEKHQELEILVLPFVDTRVMGSVELVGVMRPFEIVNQGFIDRYGALQIDSSSIMVVPSPRVLTRDHLSDQALEVLDKNNIELRALDVAKVLELDKRGRRDDSPDVPSIPLTDLLGSQQRTLN